MFPPSCAFQNSKTPTALDFHRGNVWGHLHGMCKSPLVLPKHVPGCQAAANPKDRQPDRISGGRARMGGPSQGQECPRKRLRLAPAQDKASRGCARMRDMHPRPLGWGSLQMLPCFNAAQQGMTHPSVPPAPPQPTRNGCPYFTSAVETLFGILSVKLLAVSCCCCFSPGQGVRCVGNAKTSDGVVAVRVRLQGGVAAVVFSSTFFGRAHPCQGGSGIEQSCGDKK